MTNRLKNVMPDLISPVQSSFVPERQITDNIVIYQEILHTLRCDKKKPSFMILKIDLEKAYNILDWEFVRDTLCDIGFNNDWVRNIMHYIETTRMYVLWEGMNLDWFKPDRGIRQGDPISPYIFVLCIERLSHMITEVVNRGDWKGIRVSNEGPDISHLFFVDDMVLFAKATNDQIKMILECLDNFCKCSGQKVNKHKSNIFFSNNVCKSAADRIACRAGILETNDLDRYLGVPSIHGIVTKDHCNNILERIRRAP